MIPISNAKRKIGELSVGWDPVVGGSELRVVASVENLGESWGEVELSASLRMREAREMTLSKRVL